MDGGREGETEKGGSEGARKGKGEGNDERGQEVTAKGGRTGGVEGAPRVGQAGRSVGIRDGGRWQCCWGKVGGRSDQAGISALHTVARPSSSRNAPRAHARTDGPGPVRQGVRFANANLGAFGAASGRRPPLRTSGRGGSDRTDSDRSIRIRPTKTSGCGPAAMRL